MSSILWEMLIFSTIEYERRRLKRSRNEFHCFDQRVRESRSLAFVHSKINIFIIFIKSFAMLLCRRILTMQPIGQCKSNSSVAALTILVISPFWNH